MSKIIENPKRQTLRNNEYYDFQVVQDQLYADSQNDKIFTNLMSKITNRDNVLLAYRNIKKNTGSNTKGTDGKTIAYLARMEPDDLVKFVEAKLRNYQPQAVRRVEIPKPDGKMRPLGIPTISDRLVQQCILQVLEPICEAKFYKHSYGFRPNKSAHQALKQAETYINLGYKVVVDMDLEKFFDRVNHDKLMHLISQKLEDKRVLSLIRRYLTAGVMEHGICVVSKEGTPQGGPLSPLLSNIMLNELDKMLEGRGHKFCGYADDCNIYVKSRRAGMRVMETVRRFLENELRLKINEGKSAVASPTKRKFLGYSFYYFKGIYKLRAHSKSLSKLKDKIREVTNRNVSMNFETRLKKLTEKTRGWVNYFKLADMSYLLIEYELTWIIRGQGQRYVGRQVESFEAGDLVWLGPNLPHCWINTPSDSHEEVEALVVQFDADLS